MAIAEVALAARFNRPGHQIVDHYTYVLVSDGDLEEGISSEAGSIAGHEHSWKADRSYAGQPHYDRGKHGACIHRGSHGPVRRIPAGTVQRVERSNDVDAMALALQNSREESGRPS